jgi:hypothetical protein
VPWSSEKAIIFATIKKGRSRIFEYEIYEINWEILIKGHAFAMVAWL